MSIAHKIQLSPTRKQVAYFKQACGTARFVYNWGLAEWNRQYEAGEKPNGLKLKKEFNAIKYQQFPWLEGVHRDAHARPFDQLQKAFVNFFRKTGRKPRFKKKGKVGDSFYVSNDKLKVDSKKIRLPLVGWVKMTEVLRFDGKIEGAVVSRSADRWFVSVSVDSQIKTKPKTGDAVLGVDVGIKNSITLSDGKVFQGPKSLRVRTERLRRLSRGLSRKVKGSNNWFKASQNLARLHWRIACARQDFLQQTTTRICRESQAVGLESLNVVGMLANHHLARALSDEGLGGFRRMMEYKAEPYGVDLVFADPWYPSSKTCSGCGRVESDLKLSDRVFRCECGLVIDRDLNAAINLRNLILPRVTREVTPVEIPGWDRGSRNLPVSTSAH